LTIILAHRYVTFLRRSLGQKKNLVLDRGGESADNAEEPEEDKKEIRVILKP
jgi:hypothetical protein